MIEYFVNLWNSIVNDPYAPLFVVITIVYITVRALQSLEKSLK